MTAEKRSIFILNSTHFNFLHFSKALVSCVAFSNICILRDSEDMKAHSGHGWRKAGPAFAQLHRLKRLNRNNHPQKGMVIWSSVQRNILTRDIYKRRDSKEDVTTALCQHCLQTRLGSRLLAWLGTFSLRRQFTSHFHLLLKIYLVDTESFWPHRKKNFVLDCT